MQRLLHKVSTKEDDDALEVVEIEEIHNLKSMEDGDILQDNLKQ